jgi:amidase
MAMKFEEYRSHDGLGLAGLVARKEVSAQELLRVATARLDTVNPHLNAVVTRMDQIAQNRVAGPLSGPFAGVPFLAKCARQDHAGVVSSCGSAGLQRQAMPANEHAEITRRWLDAGVVIMGLSNASEFGLKPVTEPLAHGPTRNPWHADISPGGSSGGAAAAVAAGIVPMAGGNDAGGSIRTPASACGLFGFKPGRGRTPWGPQRGEMMQGAVVHHVLTRSVRDSAAMLDATQGPERASLFHVQPPARPYQQEQGLPPGRLRIAMSTRMPYGLQPSADAKLAMQKSAQLLSSLGHHVEEADMPIPLEQLCRDLSSLVFVNAAHLVDMSKAVIGCGDEGFEPDTLIMAAFGRAMRASDYVDSLARWHDYTRIAATFLRQHDVYMTPTLARIDWRIGELALSGGEQKLMQLMQRCGLSRLVMNSTTFEQRQQQVFSYTPYAGLANLTGMPAMSVPLYWSQGNMPLGTQFMASVAGEGLLFRLAAQLEAAQPWFHRVPAQ